MMRRLRTRLTYANVMATVAVFIALGGGAYAAVKLPANSVGAKQLKKNSVTSAKLAKNTVTSAKIASNAVISSKVKDGSLLNTDFAAGQLPAGAVGPAGAKGDKGDTGPKGDTGVAGANGISVAFAHVLSTGTLDADFSKNVSDVTTSTFAGGGVFCISTTVPVRNAVGTIDVDSSSSGDVGADLHPSAIELFKTTYGCPSTTTALITTGTEAAGFIPLPFYVQFGN